MTGAFAVNILLVDDEPKNLIALEAVLAGPERNLVHATSGPEALRWVLREDFAVVLLDVHMPGMDGFETASLIRGRERSSNTPIIFLTAAIRGETHVARGYSLGAVDYIVKPFEPDILRSKVAVFVELFKASEQVKRQAQQLAETTTFLNSVLEGSTEYAIIALDLQGRFETWNEGARRLYGYSADEAVAKLSLSDLFPPEGEHAGGHKELLRRAARSGKVAGLYEQVRRGGEAFTASMVVDTRKHASGEAMGYVAISRDVTEQLRAEAERARLIEEQAARVEAEAAERRFAFLAEASAALAESLDAPVALRGLAGLIVPTLADACFVDLVDGETGEVGRVAVAVADPSKADLADLIANTPPDASPRSVVGKVLRAGKSVLREHLTARQVRGFAASEVVGELIRRLEPRSTIVVPLRAHGRVVGALTLLQAESGRCFTEADLAFVEDLGDRAALAVENARLYAEAQRAVRVRDEFLSSASHDLKTPLTVIKGHSQLLEGRAGGLGGAEGSRMVEMLGRVNQATNKIARLVDQMLDVAQLQAGRPLDLDLQHTDAVALAREAASEVQASHHQHRVTVDALEPSVIGLWDPARVERVLSNLLSNAIKYSPGGGDISVEVGCEVDGASVWARLRVVDHGVGIPADELPRVFDRFYRGRNVVGKIYGTGIGLAGVRQIVEQHGGRIAVDSVEGTGTTVTVRLPLTDATNGIGGPPLVGSATAG